MWDSSAERVNAASGSSRRRIVGSARTTWSAVVTAVAVTLSSQPVHASPTPASPLSEAVGPIVRPAQYIGGHAELRGNLRWLVVASRPSYDQAVDYAQRFSGLIAPCVVVESQNGWYAVLAGVLDMPKAELNIENLKGVRLIPQDSYLSTGRNFHTIVWSGFASGRTHDVMDQRALRSTVRRMQSALRAVGFYSDAVDGLLGRKTVAAYRRYERASGTGRNWGESFIGPAELIALEGYAARRKAQIAQERAERERREQLARLEAERRREEALRAKLVDGEWRDLDEMKGVSRVGSATARFTGKPRVSASTPLPCSPSFAHRTLPMDASSLLRVIGVLLPQAITRPRSRTVGVTLTRCALVLRTDLQAAASTARSNRAVSKTPHSSRRPASGASPR